MLRNLVMAGILALAAGLGGCAGTDARSIHLHDVPVTGWPASRHAAVYLNVRLLDATTWSLAVPVPLVDEMVAVAGEVQSMAGPWQDAAVGTPQRCSVTLRVAKGSIPKHPEAEKVVLDFRQGDDVAKELTGTRMITFMYRGDGKLDSMRLGYAWWNLGC